VGYRNTPECLSHACNTPVHTRVPNEPQPNTQVHAHMCTHPHPGVQAHTHILYILLLLLLLLLLLITGWNNVVSIVTDYELGGPGIKS